MRTQIEAKELLFMVELPDNLEMSGIAKQYQDRGSSSFLPALFELYQKYVDPSTAHLEINVNWQLRSSLRQIFAPFTKKNISLEMSDEEVLKVMMLLEQAAETVARLMNDTFLRFRRTDVYKEVVALMEKRAQPPGS